MPHSDAWARQLLQKLPDDPEDLLRRKSFWDQTFLGLYFEHLDEQIFHDPTAALKWANVAPGLARLVPKGDGPEAQREHGERLVKAHAILGGALRATSQFEAAEAEYEAGRRIADATELSPAALMDFDHRLAMLRSAQGRFDEALEIVDDAIEFYRKRAHPKLGEVLAKRAYVLVEAGRFGESIAYSGEALALEPTDSHAATARVRYAAVHNLAWAISQTSAKGSELALDYIAEAKRLLRGQRRSIHRHRLQWVQGLAWIKLGGHARAEQAFKVARRGFVRLRAPFEIALVSLDLAGLYRFFGQWADLEAVAADTFRRFRELSGDSQAVAALSLWLDGAVMRTLTDETMAEARKTIMARMVPEKTKARR